MSSGTGRATSQNSDINWKDNSVEMCHRELSSRLELSSRDELSSPTNCHPERSEGSWCLPGAARLIALARTKIPRVAWDDNFWPTHPHPAAFFGVSMPRYFITICKSFQ